MRLEKKPNQNTNIIWKPTKKQLEFLKAGSIFEVAYLGGAGSGKSSVLLVDACRQMNHSDAKAVIFRRTTKELQQLIDYSQQVYRKLGAYYLAQKAVWVFPSGGKIYFSHMESPQDKHQHDGQEYNSGVYFDEITHFEEEMYLYLHTRCRSTNPDLIPRVRCTGTPVGKHIDWVRRRFIDSGSYKIIKDKETSLSRLYIPATLDDNPHLTESDPLYEKRLRLQGENIYQALRFGDWSLIDGVAFPEIHDQTHLIDSYTPTSSDILIRGFDWGFTAPFATVWIAITRDGDLIVFKEWIGTADGSNKGLMMGADECARTIKDIEEQNSLHISYGASDPAIWGKQNEGESIGEIFERIGLVMHRANNNRTFGKQQLHMRLRVDEYTKKPKIFFTKDVPLTYRSLKEIQTDKRNPEVYDTSGFDHCVDALRYAVMERTIDSGFDSPPEVYGERETNIQSF
jgi:hypothetical protein